MLYTWVFVIAANDESVRIDASTVEVLPKLTHGDGAHVEDLKENNSLFSMTEGNGEFYGITIYMMCILFHPCIICCLLIN